mmetsp:Transcript_29745/g.45988  ORF Transcript_29745/g.45988 Transcript_29745/m.45988 type:complete len:143 (+) Transcript_29745:368-796(+)
MVSCLDALLYLSIFVTVLLGFPDHAVDFLLAQTSFVVRDGDFLFLVGRLVHGGDFHDTVLIDIKCDLDLGDAARGRWDSTEVKLTELAVVFRQGTLTFVHDNGDAWLVIRSSAEDLALLCGNLGIAIDEFRHDTTDGFNTER